MKTCVYAIALNELSNVDDFISSCESATYVVICDTGSTDGTYEALQAHASARIIIQSIKIVPWRFDVARNAALALVPTDVDVCISVDLDERLQPGWVEALESQVNNFPAQTRFLYNYVWSWTVEHTPDVSFNADKIHSRFGYVWKHPCHETLYWVGNGDEVSGVVEHLSVHHFPDADKSRQQYNTLLELATKEDPSNSRMAHYYARELMFHRRWTEAIVEFNRFLDLPSSTWVEERSMGYQYIADCYVGLKNYQLALVNSIRSTIECPTIRESWLSVATHAHTLNDWGTCLWAATKCIAIKTKTAGYISKSQCWSDIPYDLAALSCYHLGWNEQAVRYGTIAHELNPNSTRLTRNLLYYKQVNIESNIEVLSETK